MKLPIIIFADLVATEWKWVCHYIINFKRAAKRCAVYCYILVEEKVQNDVLRLLSELCLEDTTTIVTQNFDMSFLDVNVILRGSEAKGFSALYNIRDGNKGCGYLGTAKQFEIEMFFSRLFVEIDIMYKNNPQL